MLLLTGGARTTPEELRERNDCTLKLKEWDPDFFLPAMYLCPDHGPEVIKEEARGCVEAGMVAIKQGLSERASDPSIDPIAEAAAELDIPILFHAWYKTVEVFEHESNGADVAALAGNAEYLEAIERIWQNVVGKKLYLTGGIGATGRGEAFGENY